MILWMIYHKAEMHVRDDGMIPSFSSAADAHKYIDATPHLVFPFHYPRAVAQL